VRTDRNVARLSFRHSEQWRTDPFADTRVPEIDRRLKGAEMINGRLVVHSLSGHERNHLFINQHGQTFEDLSLTSGIDNPADSRAFATMDYDRDGRLDIALVNANHPLLNLYRNQFGSDDNRETPNHFVALRFVGGNQQSLASKQSTRDGYGAVVELTIDGAKLKREYRCGEGYGAQNSSTMIVGLGSATQVQHLEVRWPSGVTNQAVEVAAGSLITAYESPPQSPNGKPFDVQPYARHIVVPSHPLATAQGDQRHLEIATTLSVPEPSTAQANLRVYVTMATWCTACLEHMPHLQHLAEQFDPQQIELIGLPIDPDDTAEQLRDYYQKVAPPYRLILELSPLQRDQIQRALGDITPPDAIPATIITDDSGRVLATMAGAPTLSQLRKLAEQRAMASTPTE